MTHERDELQRRLTEIEVDLRGQSQEISLKYNSVQGQVSEASLPPLLFFHAHYPHSCTHQLDDTQSQLIRHKEEVAHLQSQLEQQKISHQQQMLVLQKLVTHTRTHTHTHTHTHAHNCDSRDQSMSICAGASMQMGYFSLYTVLSTLSTVNIYVHVST